MPCQAEDELPSAKDVKLIADKSVVRILENEKIAFRREIINLINNTASYGYYKTMILLSINDKVYKDFIEELKQKGYKVEIKGQKLYINWGGEKCKEEKLPEKN